MKNLKVKELLRKVIVVAFAGVIIVSVVACGKPEDTASTVSQPTLMTEEASDSHDVEQQDLITTGTDAQTQSAEQEKAFTWKEKAGDNTLMITTADIPLRSEPRDDADIIATVPEKEMLSYDAICVTDDEAETELGYAKLIYNEEQKIGYISTEENLEVYVDEEGNQVKNEEAALLYPDYSTEQTQTQTPEQIAQQNGGIYMSNDELAAIFGDDATGHLELEQGVDHEPTAEEIARINDLANELGVGVE